MRGVILDPITGKPRDSIEHIEEMLHLAELFPEIVAATTTNRYLAHPAAAAGISRAANAVAWANSAYTELVAANAITSTFYIAALTIMYQTHTGVDTTVEVEVDIATGAAASEVVIVTIPWSYRIDSQVGHHASQWFPLPEPKQVAANTRLSVRVRQSRAVADTFNGIKIMYQMA